MARKPVEKPAPYWYQTGKDLLENTMKEPSRAQLNVGAHTPSHNRFKHQPFLTGTWTETVSAGEKSVLYIDDRTKAVVIEAAPGTSGNALVEFTLADKVTVLKNPDAVTWTEWASGTVTEATAVRIDSQFTAIRLTATTADAVWTVREV